MEYANNTKTKTVNNGYNRRMFVCNVTKKPTNEKTDADRYVTLFCRYFIIVSSLYFHTIPKTIA